MRFGRIFALTILLGLIAATISVADSWGSIGNIYQLATGLVFQTFGLALAYVFEAIVLLVGCLILAGMIALVPWVVWVVLIWAFEPKSQSITRSRLRDVSIEYDRY